MPVILIAISAIISRNATKSWLSPASFISIFWLIFMIAPLIFASEFYINSSGLWYIALFVMACSSGGVFASSFFRNQNYISNNINDLSYDKLKIPLIISIFISLFGILCLVIFTIDFYKIKNLFLVPNLISIDRYNETLDYPIIVKYPLYFIYPSNILGGILSTKKSNNFSYKILCFIPLVISIFLGLIEGSRTSILLGSILFASSKIGIIAKTNKRDSSSIYTILSKVVIITMIFTFFFVFVQWLRQGLDSLVIELITERLKIYFFGYLSAFTIWFGDIDNIFNSHSLMSTFAGPFSIIGLIDRSLGFYDSQIIYNGVSTNIYTALRGLISDFSIFGSIIISFIIGIFFQLQFQKNVGINNFVGVLPISIFYSFILYSPLISIFHYNSIFFSWILVFIILKIAR